MPILSHEAVYLWCYCVCVCVYSSGNNKNSCRWKAYEWSELTGKHDAIGLDLTVSFIFLFILKASRKEGFCPHMLAHKCPVLLPLAWLGSDAITQCRCRGTKVTGKTKPCYPHHVLQNSGNVGSIGEGEVSKGPRENQAYRYHKR